VNRKWRWLLIGLALAALAIVWELQPFAQEPVYHGKTVTEWLDNMALFDEARHADEDGNSDYRLPSSPDVIQNDPSLRALLALGSKAVPTLERVLMQPPEWPRGKSLERLEAFAKWKWEQATNSGPSSPPPTPLDFPRFQEARKLAAALGLLALGTNHDTGALRLIEISAAPKPPGQKNRYFWPSFVVASSGLPQRHDEIVAGILAGLSHTNVACQPVAAIAARAFPKDLAIWRRPLMNLAEGRDAAARFSALLALASIDPRDGEVMALCEKTLRDSTNPPSLRSFAAAALGMAAEKATNELPLLREAFSEQNLPKGSGLHREADTAIKSIEKAAAAANAKNDPTPKDR
jgi:hypothetical protein